MGGAGMAIAQGASVFYYNPALLSQGPNFLEAGGEYLRADFDYISPLGKEFASDGGNHFIPLVGGGYKFGQFRFGLGLVAPYLLGADFKKELGSFSEISLTEIAPAVSWEPFPNFSLGAALKIGFGQIEMSQPFLYNGMVIGRVDSDANGWGVGWQVGAAWKPVDWLKLGVSYQSKTKVSLDGDSKLISPVLGNSASDLSADFYYPGRLGFGVGLEFGKWLIAADAVWFDYSSTDKVDISYDSWPKDVLLLDWKNNVFCGLGVEYSLNESWKLRTGVAYQQAVIPDNTVSPVTPDMDGWSIHAGLGYSIGKNFEVNLAYLHAWGNDRQVGLPNSGAGEYGADVNSVTMGITYKF